MNDIKLNCVYELLRSIYVVRGYAHFSDICTDDVSPEIYPEGTLIIINRYTKNTAFGYFYECTILKTGKRESFFSYRNPSTILSINISKTLELRRDRL